jgi:Protein of unknown function (DUF4087)
MNKFALLALSALAIASAAQAKPVTRCGWVQNPTPANWWLVDRAGEWTMGMQGGFQAKGMENLPDMTTKGWVETNGSYGYGCGCLRVDTDAKSKRITRIYSARAVPLKQCKADRALPRAE